MHLKSLRTLELRMNPLHHPFVCFLLDTCQNWCTKLSLLIFHIGITTLFDLETNPSYFLTLDTRFENGSLRALREVRFVYEGIAEERVWRWMTLAFPRLIRAEKERGLRVRLCVE